MSENRIVNIIDKFDKDNQYVSKYTILNEVKGLGIKFDDFNDEERYEVIGLMLTENYEDKEDGWGIYWGPQKVLIDQNGDRLDGFSFI